jgi:hypothetical protein
MTLGDYSDCDCPAPLLDDGRCSECGSRVVRLDNGLIDSALRLAGVHPDEWLCPVCGAVVPDELLDGERPPVHQHYGHPVELVARAQL